MNIKEEITLSEENILALKKDIIDKQEELDNLIKELLDLLN